MGRGTMIRKEAFRFTKKFLFMTSIVFTTVLYAAGPYEPASISDDDLNKHVESEVTTLEPGSIGDGLRGRLLSNKVFSKGVVEDTLSFEGELSFKSEVSFAIRTKNSPMDADGKPGVLEKVDVVPNQSDVQGDTILTLPGLEFKFIAKDGVFLPLSVKSESKKSFWQMSLMEGRIYETSEENVLRVTVPATLTDKNERLNHLKNGVLTFFLRKDASGNWTNENKLFSQFSNFNAQEIPYSFQSAVMDFESSSKISVVSKTSAI